MLELVRTEAVVSRVSLELVRRDEKPKVEKAFFQLASFSEQISLSERKDKSSLPVFHQESIWKIVCKVF